MNIQDIALRSLILIAGAVSAVLLVLKGQAQAVPALAIGATLSVRNACRSGRRVACAAGAATALRRLLLRIDSVDVLGLKTFRPLLDVELHPFSLVQSPVTRSLNRGVMNEYVFTSLSLDEAVTFVVVEPLDHAYLGHSLPPR